MRIDEWRTALISEEFLLVGAREPNDDGTSRAERIGKMLNGELIALFPEPLNKSPNLVRVDSRFGTIGYLSATDSVAAVHILRTALGYRAQLRGGGTPGDPLTPRMRLLVSLGAEMTPELVRTADG